MTLVAGAPRVDVDVEADADALDVRLEPAPPGTEPDETGIRLLADAVLHGRSAATAMVRVRGGGDVHYAVIVSRGGGARLVSLEPDDDGFAAPIPVAAGETVSLSIVASDLETDMAALEARVAEGGMGMGGGPEGEPPLEAAEPEPEPPDGGGFGGRDVGLAPPPEAAAPAEAAPEAPAPAAPRPAVSGSTPIDAHVAARMPADLFEDVPFDVTVTLSREQVKIPKGMAGDDQPIRVRKRGKIRISVQGTGFDIAAGTPSEAIAKLPPRGQANEYAFLLVPGEEGVGRVVVTVKQDPEQMPLAVITLSTMILPADDAPAAGVLPGRPIEGDAGVAAPPAAVAKLPTLAIEETISRGHSVLKVTAKVGRKVEANSICLLDKAAFVDGIYTRLGGIRSAFKDEKDAGVPVEAAVAHAEEMLRALGTEIARTLLGDQVNALLWARRARLTQLVVQTSGELDIPWEIVHLARVGDAERDDTSHFLGDKGLTRWLWGTHQPTELRITNDRVVAIAPDYADQNLFLPATQDEVKALHEALEMAAPQPIVTRDDVRRHIAAGFDLLHFAGHGRWRAADPRGQEIALAAFVETQDDGSAAYTDADAREDVPGPVGPEGAASAPFVFLSACDVGRLQHGATGLGGFAEVFLRGGAGVFIGCSWAVRDDVSATFAQTLYEQLITRKATLGEATAAARSATRDAHDLTALAFTVFADPRARVVRT